MAVRLDTNALLTAVEAAEVLHVDPSIVIGLSESGDLRSVFTASGERLFLTVDLLALFPDPATEQPGTGTPPSFTADPAAASAVVAAAVVIAAEADARLAQEAIDVAAAEVLAAADRAAEAAERAREARAFAATLAAESVAGAATVAADAERVLVDAAADRVHTAANEAVQTLLDSVATPRSPAAVSGAAKRLAEVVAAAADASAQGSARAAELTAEAVAQAAAQVALMVTTFEASVQAEVDASAGDLADVAAATAQSLALVTEQRVESNARLARQAGEAVDGLTIHPAVPTTYWAAQTSLPPELPTPALAREFVTAHLIARGLPHLVEDAQLVVSELTTNAVQHGQTPLVVSLEHSGKVLTLAVEDDSSVVPTRTLGSHLAVDGRGLSLVQGLSREWGVTGSADGSKAVWASFSTERS